VAGDDLIAAYLRELRFSVARLPDADGIVAEAQDHLLEAVERMDDRRPRRELEAEALARFGSAQLVARICIVESKRGAAVPTTKTRCAGLALLAAPVMALVGEIGNETTKQPKTWVHGLLVFVLAMSLPALLFGLWGLRRRNGGLGRVGLVALIFAFVSPIVSFAAGWGAHVALTGLLAVAMFVLAVEMIRARVLPVVPLVLLAIGAVAFLALALLAFPVDGVGDLFIELCAIAAVPLVVALLWLGWFMWREPAVDRVGTGPLATA